MADKAENVQIYISQANYKKDPEVSDSLGSFSNFVLLRKPTFTQLQKKTCLPKPSDRSPPEHFVPSPSPEM